MPREKKIVLENKEKYLNLAQSKIPQKNYNLHNLQSRA